MIRTGKLHIGTSGYSYPHWKNTFYPSQLSPKNELIYYSQLFNSLEVNYSFYRLPSPGTLFKWYKNTPDNFTFSLKVSRYLTHVKKLKNIEKPWEEFLKRNLLLKEKLGPFLFQFPANWKKNKERLAKFIDVLGKTNIKNNKQKYVFEFRNQSWFSDDIYELLKNKQNFSFSLIDSPEWPSLASPPENKNFIYIRLHGKKNLYNYNYSEKELKSLAEKIKKWQKEKSDIYIYFNNDASGFAPKNAEKLLFLTK